MTEFVVRQFSYKGKLTIRLQMFEFFNQAGHNNFTTAELAERFDCSPTVALRYRKQWEKWAEDQKDKAVCERCTMRDEPGNPVEDGLCQWCRWELAGLDLWEVYHSEKVGDEVLGAAQLGVA